MPDLNIEIKQIQKLPTFSEKSDVFSESQRKLKEKFELRNELSRLSKYLEEERQSQLLLRAEQERQEWRSLKQKEIVEDRFLQEFA